MIEVRTMNKPFAQSCEDNKAVILEQLAERLTTASLLLEIGSGTGQHAVHFAKHLPHIKWQPTELPENIPGIEMWMQEAALNNILKPVILNVAEPEWAFENLFDAAFTANTLHIMSIHQVEKLFMGLGKVLDVGALFFSYGPFNYQGQFSSESNANFDRWLKQRDPLSGIRDLDELTAFAANAGIELQEDIKMPMNNQILVWKKQ